MTITIAEDSWLTMRLSKTVTKLKLPAEKSPDTETLRELDQCVQREGLLFSFVPVGSELWTEQLVARGFTLIDLQVQLDKDQTDPRVVREESAGVSVRLARPDDQKNVRALALGSFHCSRFHRDPLVPKAVADVIKADWAENFFFGNRGEAMIVAEVDGRLAGFLLLVKSAPQKAPPRMVIDLIAVASDYRGRKAASQMIAFAEQVFSGSDWLVGTQMTNNASIRLYENCGYKFKEAAYVLHAHR